MLPQADLVSVAGPASAIAGVISAILAAKLHRLFGTGLSFWILLAFGCMAMFEVASCLAGFSAVASAIADISMIVAGFSAYATSRWLGERFELGEGHGR